MSSSERSPFLWGAATSSHQIEGYNEHNDWWAWELEGKVDGGVRSGAATDHLHRFREDLRLAKELGLNSYRFSFEWSRFEPREGAWNTEAVDWYHELLNECDRLDLLPMATLHHFTLPQWVAERGGFTNSNTPGLFAKFVEKIAATFGARIPLWCTVNEPMVLVGGGYLGRFMPPSVFDPAGAANACLGLLKSHVLAYDILKSTITSRTGPFRNRPLEVGFAHNMTHIKPERRFNLIESVTARTLSYLHNDAWLEATNGEKQKFGYLGLFPRAHELAVARNRRTFDFIGINYYTKALVRWRPRTRSENTVPEAKIGVSFARRHDLASDLDWAVHPHGFSLMLDKLKRFNVPIYVTENGIADGDDRLRGEFIKSHLSVLAEQIQSGLDIRGYFHWSLLDNFEWIKGFWPRFGLYEVNYQTFDRKPRASALLYKKIISAHSGGAAPQTEILNKISTAAHEQLTGR